MRATEAHVIAIFGPSGSGKTTVARLLARDMGLPLRECGEAVKALAKARGVSFSDLTDQDHASVDAETLKWAAEQTGPCVIEGRFLDKVLAVLQGTGRLVLVRLDASTPDRSVRLSGRFKADIDADKVASFDYEDGTFRERVYGGAASMTPDLIVDTSGREPDECMLALKEQLAQLGPHV